MAWEPSDRSARDMPPALVPAQGAAILGLAETLWMVRGDEIDSTLCRLGVEQTAVVGHVAADQEPGERFRKAA